MSKAIEQHAEQDALPVSRDAILAQFAPMLTSVPDAVDDDGSGIIADILQASTWEGVNTEGSMPNSEKLIGVRMKITAITKRESDIEGGLPFYLIADYVNTDTGEVGKFQTSSTTIVAQLVKLRMLGALPCVATVEKSDKATKAGFFPHSLRVFAADAGK